MSTARTTRSQARKLAQVNAHTLSHNDGDDTTPQPSPSSTLTRRKSTRAPRGHPAVQTSGAAVNGHTTTDDDALEPPSPTSLPSPATHSAPPLTAARERPLHSTPPRHPSSNNNNAQYGLDSTSTSSSGSDHLHPPAGGEYGCEGEHDLTSPIRKLSASHDSPTLRARTLALNTIDSIKTTCAKYQLLTYETIPDWLRDNKHIHRGYRVNIGWRHSCESVCHFHNETINVWTHIIACLFVLILLVLTLNILSPHGMDRINLNMTIKRKACFNTTDDFNSTSPTNHSACFSTRDDPLEVLHTLLGKKEPEYLADLVNRIENHVPSLQQLITTLKYKSQQLSDDLYKMSMDNAPDATVELLEFKESTRRKFKEYVEQVEQQINALKQSLKPSAEDMSEKYDKLLQYFQQQQQSFVPSWFSSLSVPTLDIMDVTRRMIDDFQQNFIANVEGPFQPVEGGILTIPDIDLSVKNVAGLGEGKIDFLELFSHTPVEVEGEKQYESTEIQNDGSGRTSATNIGFMHVEAHTDTNAPDELQIALHSFLPRWPLVLFMISAMACLVFSSAYHLFAAVSDTWASRFQSLDYAGICLLIAGSTVPIIYYGFYCQPYLRLFYISAIAFTGLVVFLVVVLPKFKPIEYRVLKVVLFITLAFFGMVPFSHFVLLMGELHFIFWYLIAMGVCYLGGAVIYTFQIPERWAPGYFDYIGHSHQLWHCAIFFAIAVHYLGLLHMYEWRMTRVCLPGA